MELIMVKRLLIPFILKFRFIDLSLEGVRVLGEILRRVSLIGDLTAVEFAGRNNGLLTASNGVTLLKTGPKNGERSTISHPQFHRADNQVQFLLQFLIRSLIPPGFNQAEHGFIAIQFHDGIGFLHSCL